MNNSAQVPAFTEEFVQHSLSNLLQHASLKPSQQALIFGKVTTDSRSVAPGDLFVALAGEKSDGHQFIETALKAGAKGIICAGDKIPPEEVQRQAKFFIVKDTLQAYRKLAAHW